MCIMGCANGRTAASWRGKNSVSVGAHMKKPSVGVIMGSKSDWEVMQHAVKILKDFAVPCDAKVMSAHRTPEIVREYVRGAAERGTACIIAGAGGAAHLAGVVAAHTILPVLGVPMPSKHLQGVDSLLSTVQMPKGIPVAAFAIGEAGAVNAALFAVAMLALNDGELAQRLSAFRQKQAEAVNAATLPNV
jgi:5-(carboxyamino)imidazole ribonucleotide mutase